MTAPWRYQHVGAYLAAVRRAHAALAAGKRIRMWWGDWEGVDRAGFRKEFVAALHRRITRKVEPDPRGRKDSQEYRTGMLRDKYRLIDSARRIRIYEFETDDCRRRFGDRLATRDE